MARAKPLNIVVRYADTPYVVNDLGQNKSPRFELLDKTTQKVIEKSDNPMDFDEIVLGVNENVELAEEPKRKRGRSKKTAG